MIAAGVVIVLLVVLALVFVWLLMRDVKGVDTFEISLDELRESDARSDGDGVDEE